MSLREMNCILNGAQRKTKQNVFLIIPRLSNRFSYRRFYILPLRTVSIYCIRNYISAATRRNFFFFSRGRSVIPLKGRRYPWCLPLKKIDGQNEIRHRRWRYFIVPDDRFRCEIPTRDIVPFASSRCRFNCKLKASSAPDATLLENIRHFRVFDIPEARLYANSSSDSYIADASNVNLITRIHYGKIPAKWIS